jgi:hypothetical protein
LQAPGFFAISPIWAESALVFAAIACSFQTAGIREGVPKMIWKFRAACLSGIGFLCPPDSPLSDGCQANRCVLLLCCAILSCGAVSLAWLIAPTDQTMKKRTLSKAALLKKRDRLVAKVEEEKKAAAEDEEIENEETRAAKFQICSHCHRARRICSKDPKHCTKCPGPKECRHPFCVGCTIPASRGQPAIVIAKKEGYVYEAGHHDELALAKLNEQLEKCDETEKQTVRAMTSG